MQLPGVPVTLLAHVRSYLSFGLLLAFQPGSAWFSAMAFFDGFSFPHKSNARGSLR